MALFEVRGLRKAFGRHVVLDGLDIDIFDGEVIKPQTTDRAHVITFEDVPADKKKEALLASRLFIEDLWDRV